MIIPSGYAQANLIFTGSGLPEGAEITMGLDVSAWAGTVADAAEEVFTLADASNLIEQLSVGVSLTSVLVKFGPASTGPSAVYSGSSSGLEGGGTPPNVSILVQKVTAAGGRAGRGRSYLPSPNESKVDPAGNLDSTYRSNIETSYNAWLATLLTNDLGPVLLHGAGSPLTTPTPIISGAVAAKVATQRRRLR